MTIEKNLSWTFEIICMALIVTGAPLYGAVTSYPAFILGLLSLGLCAVLLIRNILDTRARIYYPKQIIYLFVFLGLACLQIVPIPAGLVNALSPHTISLFEKYQPGFSDTSVVHLSIYGLQTRYALIGFTAQIILFLCMLNAPAQRGTFRRLFLVIILTGTVLALFAIARKFMLGERAIATFGTFVNRNHYAAFMTLIAPIAAGYAFACEDRFKKILFLFFSAVITLSIFLSLSRAGSLSVITSFALMFLLLKKNWQLKEKIFAAGAGCLLIALLAGITGVGGLQERFGLLFKEGLKNERALVAWDSLKIIKDFPVFGVGWGNFPYVFPLYKGFVSHGYFRELHNDHLQLIVETGIVAAFFYFYFLVSMLKNVVVRAQSRNDPFVVAITIAGACGIFGLLLHSFFDFNFHVPAIAFLFWMLLGMICKTAHTHFEQ